MTGRDIIITVSLQTTYRQHRDLVDVGPAADLQRDLSDRRAVRRTLNPRVRGHRDDIIVIRRHDDDIIIGCRQVSVTRRPPVVRFRRQQGGDGPELPVHLAETNRDTSTSAASTETDTRLLGLWTHLIFCLTRLDCFWTGLSGGGGDGERRTSLKHRKSSWLWKQG